MKIIISGSSPMAIYEQIVSQVKDAIIQKEIVEGEAMPSIRALARDLQVSVITTKKAYEELEKENLIKSVAGKGFYVCKQDRQILKEKQMMQLEERYQQIVQESKNVGISLEELIDLITVLYKNE